jgi:hypothetical protein
MKKHNRPATLSGFNSQQIPFTAASKLDAATRHFILLPMFFVTIDASVSPARLNSNLPCALCTDLQA